MGVHACVLHVIVALILACPTTVRAQPGMPSFCFVLAQDQDSLRPITEEVGVVQRFREREAYAGWNGSWLRPPATIKLTNGRYLRDSSEHWLLFRPLGGKADAYLVISVGADSMRIALPEHEQELWERAMVRSGSRDSPEVIRFRTGDHRIEDLIADRWAVDAANELNTRYVQEEQRAYKARIAQQEVERQARAMVAGPSPLPQDPVKRTKEQAARIAGIKRIVLHRIEGDSVWLRVSGQVMLDGGCASNRPLLGLEMRTGTGWVASVPMAYVQMDCGMPWAEWRKREVMLPPLMSWVARQRPQGQQELVPGHYRVVLRGANGELAYSKAFRID